MESTGFAVQKRDNSRRSKLRQTAREFSLAKLRCQRVHGAQGSTRFADLLRGLAPHGDPAALRKALSDKYAYRSWSVGQPTLTGLILPMVPGGGDRAQVCRQFSSLTGTISAPARLRSLERDAAEDHTQLSSDSGDG